MIGQLVNPGDWMLCSCQRPPGVKRAAFTLNSTDLHDGFVRVHELDGSVDPVDTALQIWKKDAV